MPICSLASRIVPNEHLANFCDRQQIPNWGILTVGSVQTSILAKVIAPDESNINFGQFVLQSPNGSNDSKGRAAS
jgi:hypothetical protein